MKLIKIIKDSLLASRLEWTTNYYIRDKEKLVRFLELIFEFKTNHTLVDDIKSFRALPEFDREKRPFSSLSEQSSRYFTNLDLLYCSNPLLALKLATALCCHEEIFYDNDPFITKLKSTVHRYFFLDKLALDLKLEFCILCINNWPIINPRDYEKESFFSDILPKLFIQYADKSPKEALELFEKKFPKNNTYFFSLFENHSNFLQFISNYIEERPLKYIETLCQHLRDSQSYKRSEENIREAGKKLYELTNNPKYTDILSTNNNQYLKQAYATLLWKSYPDESWYPILADSLWEVIANDLVTDTTLLGYYCTMTINASSNFTHIKALCKKYTEGIISYKSFPVSELEKFEEHAQDHIISLINFSLCEYPFYRNCYTSVTDISNTSNQFIDTIIYGYWEMVEWLFKNNLSAYFYVLKVAIQKDSFECEVTNQIAIKAEKELFLHLEKFIRDYRDEAINFIGKVIGDSRFSNYRNYLFPFLNRLIPIIIQLNPDIAKAAVQKGLNYQKYDRQRIWKPDDLLTNPVYQGIVEPKIIFL